MPHKPLRSLTAVLTIVAMVTVMMPASAFGAVTLTWERNWGSEGLGNGQFSYASDVATDKWGNVYVAGGENGDHRVQMFSSTGAFIRSVGTVTTASTLLDKPRSVATDRWGYVYVGEKGNGGRVNVFFPELYSGASARTIDGVGDGAISGPNAVATSLDGSVYVNDNDNYIKRFASTGDYWGRWVSLGSSTLGLGVAQDGAVYTTTDTGSGITESVIKYSAVGGYLTDWGGNGTGTGEFQRPYDVATDPLENVYVIESQGGRAQVFDSDGMYQMTFGTVGIGDDQFNNPYGISAGLDRNVYVADHFNFRISKWTVDVPTEAVEIAGIDRIKTAVEASEKAYPDGAVYAVVATAYNWPDALGGAALAGMLKGPLLLTNPNSLSVDVQAELGRLDVSKVYILGGDAAVSATVEDQIKATVLSGITERLYGDNRYRTSEAIATEVVELKNANGGYDGTAFVATGQDFPDALAASPIAAANVWPIYLTPPDTLQAGTFATMLDNGSNHGYILGGTSAVSAAVASALEVMSPLPPGAFTRIDGANRYQTAANIAEAGFEDMGMLWSRPAIAVGTNYPDSLAGGVLQGSDYSLLLLTPSTGLNSYAAAALAANRDSIYEMRFLGGTTVLPRSVRDSAMALLH